MKVEIKPASQAPTIKFPCLMEHIETCAIYLISCKSELDNYVGVCSNQLVKIGEIGNYLNPYDIFPFKGQIALTNGN